MSSTTAALPVRESSFPRVFGARPFHTDGDLLALGFAPDGSLWSVEEPGILRHWDLSTQQQLAWHALAETATLWCFSPGARFVAAASDELTVWDVASGQVLAARPQSSWVTAVAFRPDAGLLATGHDDHVVRLWDMSRHRVVRELCGHDCGVSALAFSPDGRRLASAGEGRDIRVWDVETGATVASLAGHTDRIPALALSPDGWRLYSAGWDTTARVWDLTTGEPIILLNTHAGQVYTLALSPDGKRLACADSANAVHIWDTDTYRTLHVLPAQAGEVRCLAFSPDSQRLAAGGAERIIRAWDARRGPDAEDAVDPQLSRTCLAVSPDGQRLESLGAGTTLRIWDTTTARPVFPLEGAKALRTFAASPDGRWIAASTAEPLPPGGQGKTSRSTLGLWDARNGRHLRPLEGQAAPVTALAFSADSSTLASASYQGSDVWLWRVPGGEPILLIPRATEGCSVEALAFHPQGRLLAAGGIDWMATDGLDGQVFLWDVAARRRVAVLRGGAVGLAFHPAGWHLAAASPAHTVRVWDVPGGNLIHELAGHLDAVNCVAYSPDGRWLASGGDDHAVRLWDAETGLARGAAELDSQVKALCFAPDGRHLFTGNGNSSCYRLDLRQLLDEGL
jgi:WD40 repeat protein